MNDNILTWYVPKNIFGRYNGNKIIGTDKNGQIVASIIKDLFDRGYTFWVEPNTGVSKYHFYRWQDAQAAAERYFAEKGTDGE